MKTITFSGHHTTLSAVNGGETPRALRKLTTQAMKNSIIAARHGDDNSVSFWEMIRCQSLTKLLKLIGKRR